jgi:hypothetical protein
VEKINVFYLNQVKTNLRKLAKQRRIPTGRELLPVKPTISPSRLEPAGFRRVEI